MKPGAAAFVAIVSIAAVVGAAQAAASSWSFRVLLDDEEIGRHTFTAEPSGEATRVVSDARFEVRFLFVTAYRYIHRADERWRDGCLVGLDARTDTNGAREAVRLSAAGDRWRVERSGGVELHAGCLKTFAYWDRDILGATRLLNAQTGELLPVRATAVGTEAITVRGQRVMTSRHRLTAPGLLIELWYAGRDWVALESPAEGGRRLRYELL